MKQNNFTRMVNAMHSDTSPRKEDLVRADLAKRIAALEPGRSFRFEGMVVRRLAGKRSDDITVSFPVRYAETSEAIDDLLNGFPCR